MAKPKPADRLARLRERLAAAPQCISTVIDNVNGVCIVLMACPSGRGCRRCDAARKHQRATAPMPPPRPTAATPDEWTS